MSFRKNRKLALIAVLLLLVAMLPANASFAADAHNGTLRLPVMTTLTTTDPHYASQNADYMLYTVLYESFYDIDEVRNISPRLATGYDVSDDGLTYTYYLRPGVTWQTGGEFTAADVIYSVKRAQESPYMAGYVAQVSDVKALDELTVQFTLASISPTFVYRYQSRHVRK